MQLPTLNHLMHTIGNTQLQATWWCLEHKVWQRMDAAEFLLGHPPNRTIPQATYDLWLNGIYKEYVATIKAQSQLWQPGTSSSLT